MKEVCRRVGISRAEVYRRIDPERRDRDSNPFPLPVKDGEHQNSRVLFLEEEIDQYLTNLFKRRA